MTDQQHTQDVSADSARPSQVDIMFERYGSKYRIYVTLTLLLGLIALGMSITIVNVAIPYIKGAFGMSADQVEWLSTGFLAATAIALLVAPWLIRAFGLRLSYMGLLVVFIIGSFIGGFATGMGAIIIARVVQGAMTGVIRPVALDSLFAVFPPDRRGMAMALYGMCMGLPLTLASVLGGYLIENFTWHYVFFVAIPLCIAATVMGSIFLPGREETGPRPPFDWVGTITAFAAIFIGLAALSNGQRWGWHSDKIIEFSIISLLAAVFFVWWERRQDMPLLDLGIFKCKGFMAGAVLVMLFGGVFYGVMYLLPLFMEEVLHYNPVTAGMLFLPSTVVLAILVPLVGYLSDRIPPQWIIVPALGFAIWGVLRMSQIDWNTSFFSLALSMGILSITMACLVPPVFTRAINDLPDHLLVYGTGAINLALQLGGAFFTPFIVLMMERRTVLHGTQLTTGLNPGNPVARHALHHLAGIAQRTGTSAVHQGAAARHMLGGIDQLWAAMYSYQDSFLIITAATVVIIIPTFLLGYWTRDNAQTTSH